jgi:uncharacterized protein (DUF433 family)
VEPTAVVTSHIELRDTPAGVRKAYIAGSRITVGNVYVAHVLMGQSPVEMAESWPSVSLAQIHSALAYYYEHADEVREQVEAGRAYAEEMERRAGPGILAGKLAQLREAGNSIPS